MFKQLTLEQFSNETAANTPTPGGGSIAAEAGAIAYSLAEMVANLSIGKEKYIEHEDDFKALIDQSSKLRSELLDDIDRDANSFNEVMKAFKLPKETDEEKQFRSSEIQKGYQYAASVPLSIAEKMIASKDLFSLIIEHGNTNAITDALVGLMNLRTAILSSLLNVQINLESIKDQDFVLKTKDRINVLAKEIKEFESSILSKYI